MFKTFSSIVAALYERASHVDPHEFPAEAVQLARRLIPFDGAVLGVRSADITIARHVAINRPIVDLEGAALHGVEDELLPDEAFASAFLWALSKPVAFDWKDLGGAQEGIQHEHAASRRNMNKMLGFGDAAGGPDNARWIVLYRSGEEAFGKQDRDMLHTLWPHVRQAVTFNLERALYRSDPERSAHAMALVNSRGLIETCDRKMSGLLKLEWPECSGSVLPAAAVTALIQGGLYRGKRIELTGSQKYGYMVCTATRNPLLGSLAPSEMNVADRFARGMTHKQIAAHLNVSPHTVRNQLAQIYLKLGVHGKVELARLMSRI